MNDAAHYEDLADDILAHLTLNAGEFAEARKLGQLFGVSAPVIRKRLEALAHAGSIRAAMSGRILRYYVPSAAQRAALEAPLKKRSTGQYKPPQDMLDKLAEIREQREQYPSHFGGATQQWKARRA